MDRLEPRFFERAIGWARARLSNVAWRPSKKAALALSLGLLAAVLLGISAFLFLPSATLQIVCRHEFRSADMIVSVDGQVVDTQALTGSSRKVFGVLEKTEGTYVRTLPVSAGRHAVAVRVRAPGFDRTRTIEGDFTRGRESTLAIDAGRGLSLAWRGTAGGGSSVEAASGTSSWVRYAGSILMTILGSIVSASIGVFVQDFFRARKARLNETGEIRPDRSKIAS
jgi:hypothetical protein